MRYKSALSALGLTLLMPTLLAATEASPVQGVKTAPEIVHSHVGDSSAGVAGSLKLINIGKKQQFSAAAKDSYDTDIHSPKSATFSLNDSLFYINSLEGCKTVVYDSRTLEKKAVIEHSFSSGEGDLWAKPSGFYPFTHYQDGQHKAFKGKPVESTWSHNGRYLWVPYYRRTFDINAQDPSALAVIDTKTHSIIKMFETGPLPKMVATSPDGKYLAVTHWGNNTVGLMDISSNNPDDWHHLAPVTIGRKLDLNYSLTTSVDRDSNSGYLLRGTVFTPDSRYLLVSAMGGPLSVIDVAEGKLVGMVNNIYGVRHLAIADGNVYGSCNSAGSVIKFSLDSLVSGVERAKAAASNKIVFGGGVKTCKVGGGARTLDVSPDGKYLFVACNTASAVYVVDAAEMKVVDSIRCDSYPVGLALSADGRRMIVTSQGKKTGGGNAVNIFEVRRPDLPAGFRVADGNVPVYEQTEDSVDIADTEVTASTDRTDSDDTIIIVASIIIGALAGGALLIFYPRKKDKDEF